jgi:ketosteroid isomerase-like protein
MKLLTTPIAALLVLLSLTASAFSSSHSSPKKAIRAVLDKQVAEWNRADIPAFMSTYVKSDELRFSSGGTVQRGYEETLQRYLRRYPTPDAMGHLEFVDLEILILSQDWAQVHGRYQLKRTGDYGDATGLFTLLLKNTETGWKILHDHTSAGE